jgi:hypothetical protein
MIRSGKSLDTPWLTQSHDTFQTWCEFNGIKFNGLRVFAAQSPSEDPSTVQSKGLGLIASTDQAADKSKPLVSVPREMVLSRGQVEEMAKGDAKLAELLRTCGTLAMTPRVAVMVFLLFQATVANPNVKAKIGRSTPFIDYLKFLSIPPLPTLYSEAELALFAGTTLVPATEAKVEKLRSEFESLRRKTQQIPWLGPIWWEYSSSVAFDEHEFSDANATDDDDDGDGHVSDMIQFDDWLVLDALYRSRGLEWPGEGEAMAPGIDMANHSIPANVEYEVLPETGEGTLIVKGGISPRDGEELNLSYGDHKSALEFLFSYGFLPEPLSDDASMLLSLSLSDSDPLAPPKAAVSAAAGCAPGIRVYMSDGLKWDSEALWLLIVNEEDGLGFTVAQKPDGQREILMTWKEDLTPLHELKSQLEKEELWEVFLLRATVTVLSRAEAQLVQLSEETEKLAELPRTVLPGSSLWRYSSALRSVELSLLENLMETLEKEVRLYLVCRLTWFVPDRGRDNRKLHLSSPPRFKVTWPRCQSPLTEAFQTMMRTRLKTSAEQLTVCQACLARV